MVVIIVFFILYAINYVCKYGNFGVILQGIRGKNAIVEHITVKQYQ